jgi:hypothetical protein
MTYLVQILKMIDDLNRFYAIFYDFDETADELKYEEAADREDLANELLYTHFGLTFGNDRHLGEFTKAISNNIKLQAAVETMKDLKEYQL